jgi:predicted Zn-dependent protease
MKDRTGNRMIVLALCAAIAALTGCAGVRSGNEADAGNAEFARTVDLFGGVYEDRKLSDWLGAVGDGLALHCGRPDLRFTFTILDTGEVNAFSTSGGHIYVTRGLLALAANEAEVAAVLAHEMGHIVRGDQFPRRQSQSGAGDFPFRLSPNAAELTLSPQSGSGATAGFSVEQEYGADEVGIRIVAEAGYDPAALASFLLAVSRYAEPTLEPGVGARAEPGPTYAGDHPLPEARIARAAETAARQPLRGAGTMGRESYLRAVDGMVYGGGAAEGYLRGGVFVLPRAGVRFRIPQALHPRGSPLGMIATGADGSVLVMTRARPGTAASPLDYLTTVWARNLTLRSSEPAEAGGHSAAIGAAHADSDRGPLEIRLIAIGWSPVLVYRLMLVAPAASRVDLDARAGALLASFEPLTHDEEMARPPYRLSIVLVHSGDTLSHLLRRMKLDSGREDRFRALNRLAITASLRPGQQVKIVD